MINLIELNENITLRVQHLCEQVIQTGREIEVPVSELKKYLHDIELLQLADSVIFTRLVLIEGQVYPVGLKIYLDDEDDQPKVFDAARQPQAIPNLQFLQYETGLGGFGIVQMGQVKAKVALSIEPQYQKQLKAAEGNEASLRPLLRKGAGAPPLNWLKYRPLNTTPLKDLEIGLIYKVLQKTGMSKKYNTNRYLLESFEGTQFESYANKSLESLIARKGIPCEFEILAKKEGKDGTIIVKVDSPETASLATLTL